jgi:predicted MFS family arabinose efflux permease
LHTVERQVVPARESGIPTRILLLMSISAGVVVANLYYNQPLLELMARSFNTAPRWIGLVPTLTQIGYAVGMLLFIPLGDVADRRRLILTMSVLSIGALIAAALAPSFVVLAIASLAVGVFSIVPQLLVPLAAYLARAEERGRAVGDVMSGLLIGILLARTVAGTVGEHLGWHAMYWVASGLMAAITIAMWAMLPRVRGEADHSYVELQRSLLRLVKTEPVLREAAFVGAMLFGTFSALWATLVFLLANPPYHYGSQMAGLFGLVGVAGGAAAPIAGRMADKRDRRANLRVAIVVVIVAFVVLLVWPHNLWALVVGVILLDGGVQSGQVTNQSRIYSLIPEAHNRLNTVYMVTYFVGGALGSALGTFAWDHWSWTGVAATGLILCAAAMAPLLRRRPPETGTAAA